MRDSLKRFLLKHGWLVSRVTPANWPPLRIARMLEAHAIGTVLDVGANVGRYAEGLFDAGYGGRVVCFEPVSSAYRQLVRNSRRNSRWIVATRCALADYDGEASINVSADLDSSSLLEPTNLARRIAPGVSCVRTETVPVRTLASAAQAYVEPDSRVFVKLDVQGAEEQVLSGAGALMDAIWGVQQEMSLFELYEDQKLFREMLDSRHLEGFELHALLPGFSDFKTGTLLQVDGVFFRAGSIGQK